MHAKIWKDFQTTLPESTFLSTFNLFIKLHHFYGNRSKNFNKNFAIKFSDKFRFPWNKLESNRLKLQHPFLNPDAFQFQQGMKRKEKWRHFTAQLKFKIETKSENIWDNKSQKVLEYRRRGNKTLFVSRMWTNFKPHLPFS